MRNAGKICSVPGCGQPAFSGGICAGHYSQVRRTGKVAAVLRRRKFNSSCVFPGCSAPAKALGFCAAHYRQHLTGAVLHPVKTRSGVATACLFSGCKNPRMAKGYCSGHYAQLRRGKKLVPLLHIQADGRCSFPGCVRPHMAKGLCHGHRSQQLRGAELTPLRRHSTNGCQVEGCGEAHYQAGYCGKHYYERVQRHDPLFIAKNRMRARVRNAVRDGNISAKTMELVGCTLPELKAHIESLFSEGMSWAKLLAGEIHLDHIMPCAMFDLLDPAQQRECFHYTNLQPLWAKDNLLKRDRSPEEWAKLAGGSVQ